MKGKIQEIYKELKLLENNNETSLLTNLTKAPAKEPNDVMPHTTAPVENATHQADILFLPDDDGFKYLLVVVDIATRKTDAQPLKSKDSDAVLKAIQKIYKRKILKLPKRIEVDAGKEFKGEFMKYFEKYSKVLTKLTGRHRQQSVVETKNYQFGKILNERMLVEEINNDEESHSWVDIVPQVVNLLNKYFSIKPILSNPEDKEKVNNKNKNMLPVGTRVRIQLDNPMSYQGDKLHGKFRAGDVRWSKQVHTITDYFLRPGQPPMYQIDNRNDVAYTIYQLQEVNNDEVRPSTKGQKKWIVKQLLERKKIKNKIYFDVLWSDGSKTTEPRSNLIKDIPDMVREFEGN